MFQTTGNPETSGLIYGLDDISGDASIYDYWESLKGDKGYQGILDHLNEPVRVTEECYWHFLEIMPPCYFEGNSFCLIEALMETPAGTVRAHFWQSGEKYYFEYAQTPEAQEQTDE